MSLNTNDFAARYRTLWQDFIKTSVDLHNELEVAIAAGHDISLHTVLTGMHTAPYDEARKLLRGDAIAKSSENIGAVTGLFFEHSASTLLVAALRRRLPNARFERNICSSEAVRRIARDPDLYISNGTLEAVVEIKASPKKRDIAYVLGLHERYEQHGAAYFLVGGHVSIHARELRAFRDRGWATFTSCSPRNRKLLQELPTIDGIVDALAARLGAPSHEFSCEGPVELRS